MREASLPAGHMLAFHGSPHEFDIRELKRESHGSFGSGYYFCGDAQHALVYSGEDEGACVLVADLQVANPYIHKVREPTDVDCWGEGLVLDLFPPIISRRLIEKVLNGEWLFGPEIGVELFARGHDALVARFEDGSCEIVVLDASQIRLPDSPERSEIVLPANSIRSESRRTKLKERPHVG